MIFKEIMCDLKSRVEELGYFQNVYSFVEVVTEIVDRGKFSSLGLTNPSTRQISFPRHYLESGEYEDIFQIDEGTAYFRKFEEYITSSVEVRAVEDVTTSCDSKKIEVKYPMRLIAATDKIGDDSFSDDKLIYELMNAISGKITGLSSGSANVIPNGYTTNKNLVYKGEIDGIEQLVNPKYSFVALNFDLFVVTTWDCLDDDCYG